MEGIGKVAVKELEIPSPKPNEVLIRIHNCNICTSDWQTWKGLRKSLGRAFPWASGHEMSGEIVKVGSAVTNPNLKPGVHIGVGAQGSRGCGECCYCREGHPSSCSHKPGEIEIDGIQGSFGFSQYAPYESDRVYTISSDLPYEEAGFIEPVSTCVHGAKRLKIRPVDKVLVVGAGNLGMVNAQVASFYGGDVIVSEIVKERCDLARAMGFAVVNPAEEDFRKRIMDFTGGRGMDVIILAVGNTHANNQAFSAIAKRGRILFFASAHPASEMNISANDIHYKEIELIGTYNSDPSDYETAAQLLSNGDVKVKNLISRTFSMDECERAFEMAATPGTYRVSVALD